LWTTFVECGIGPVYVAVRHVPRITYRGFVFNTGMQHTESTYRGYGILDYDGK